MVMFAIQNMTDIRSAHVTVRAVDLKQGMTIQVTDSDMYRDENGDLIYQDQTWQATVSETETVWNAPSEMYVHFTDGPAAWILKIMRVPVVMGPVNSSGKF